MFRPFGVDGPRAPSFREYSAKKCHPCSLGKQVFARCMKHDVITHATDASIRSSIGWFTPLKIYDVISCRPPSDFFANATSAPAPSPVPQGAESLVQRLAAARMPSTGCTGGVATSTSVGPCCIGSGERHGAATADSLYRRDHLLSHQWYCFRRIVLSCHRRCRGRRHHCRYRCRYHRWYRRSPPRFQIFVVARASATVYWHNSSAGAPSL